MPVTAGPIRELARIAARPATLGAAAAFACFHFSTWLVASLFVTRAHPSFSLMMKTGAFESISWLLVGAAGVAVGWLLPLDVRKRPSVAGFAALFAAGLVLVIARLMMIQLLAAYGSPGDASLLAPPAPPGARAPALTTLLLSGYPWYLMIATSYIGLGWGLRGVRRYYDGVRELARMDAELAEVRFAALRNRLHPRVLGAMETIATEIQADQDHADEQLMRLSDFIRLQMGRGRLDAVPLRDELAFVREYLEFERACCGAETGLELAVPPALADVLVPTGCVTAAVEALLRARGPRGAPLQISVRAEGGRHALRIAVTTGAARGDGPEAGDEALERLAATLSTQVAAADRPPVYAPAEGGLVVTLGASRPRPRPLRRGDEIRSPADAEEPDAGQPRAAPAPDPGPEIREVFRTWFLGYWMIIAVLGISQDFLLGRPFTPRSIAASLALNVSCVLLWAAVCWITLALARGTGRLHPRRIGLGVLAAFALGVANHLLQTLVWCFSDPFGMCFVNSIPILGSTVAITLNLFAVGLVVRAAALTAMRDRRSSLIRAEMTRSQTLALERQLRPHFCSTRCSPSPRSSTATARRRAGCCGGCASCCCIRWPPAGRPRCRWRRSCGRSGCTWTSRRCGSATSCPWSWWSTPRRWGRACRRSSCSRSPRTPCTTPSPPAARGASASPPAWTARGSG